MGGKIRFTGAPGDSLPPCGGGMGWGVVRGHTAVPHSPPPPPSPPHKGPQGGGEEIAAAANRILAPMGPVPAIHVFLVNRRKENVDARDKRWSDARNMHRLVRSAAVCRCAAAPVMETAAGQ